MPVTDLKHEFHPAAAGSFDGNRAPIDRIVLHTMDGFFLGTRTWFANKNRSQLTSAHYGVSFEGSIDCYVDEGHTAYHVGNYATNTRSIGIEFEDKKKPNDPRPDALYQTGERLIADIAKRYSIPLNRQHVLIHREVSPGRACPGSLDVDRLIAGANALLAKPTPTPTEPTSGVSLAPSTFEFLVTTSRNFKEVASLFGHTSNEAINNPTLGEEIRQKISRLQIERDYWYNQAQISSTPPKPILTELFEDKTNTSTPQVRVLNRVNDKNEVVNHGKNLLHQDLTTLLARIRSIFWK